jgi:hypothetical protein
MGLFPALSAFERVQNLVTLIDARARLVLALERRRILQIANDAPVDEPDLRREIELRLHVRITGRLGGCSNRDGRRLRGLARNSFRRLAKVGDEVLVLSLLIGLVLACRAGSACTLLRKRGAQRARDAGPRDLVNLPGRSRTHGSPWRPRPRRRQRAVGPFGSPPSLGSRVDSDIPGTAAAGSTSPADANSRRSATWARSSQVCAMVNHALAPRQDRARCAHWKLSAARRLKSSDTPTSCPLPAIPCRVLVGTVSDKHGGRRMVP